MQPPGGVTWLTWRCRAVPFGRRAGRPRRRRWRKLAVRRQRLPASDARSPRSSCSSSSAASSSRWSIGSLAGAARPSASASSSRERWNPVTEKFGALAPIYGTLVTSLIAMLIAVPVGLVHRDLPHRALPAVAAPPDRHRHRAARRHSQHHLRHLGPVRLRAVPAGDAAAVPDRRRSATSRCCRRCSPARPTASAC